MKRSIEKELLDTGEYEREEYQDCLKKLFFINRLFGFYKDTVSFLKKVPCSSLMDVGCGDGRFVLALKKRFSHIAMTGVEIAEEPLSCTPQGDVTFSVRSRYDEESVDIIITTLVCHHLDDHELVDFLKTLHRACKKAVVINDLHRHLVSLWLFTLISPLFNNRLIRYDGPLSIQKGFRKQEWRKVLEEANIKNFEIRWRFPFRWQVILWKR